MGMVPFRYNMKKIYTKQYFRTGIRQRTQYSIVQYTVYGRKEDFFVPVLLQLRVLVLPNPFLPVKVFLSTNGLVQLKRRNKGNVERIVI